jgi:2-polyprenyl-6-hydroxyphenyl methylase/3-demethylubiquinone-9 3-methyltransferase
MSRSYEAEAQQVLARLREAVMQGGNANDVAYFMHERRYLRTAVRVMELLPRGATVLDVGSHYLHQAALLSMLGYRVIGMDVAAFADVAAIKARAEQFEIRNFTVERFEDGDFLPGMRDAIDLVLFCEIQEHITFNPVRFWRRIHELMKVGGKIFLTTPNSMRLWHVLSIVKRALLREGAGPPVRCILGTVTYGHHWKEYSAREIVELFSQLSPDFEVAIAFYHDRPFEPWSSFKAAVRDASRRLATRIPPLSEEIEAVITLRGRSTWQIEPPQFF